MLTITIGDSERTFASRGSIDEAWVNQQFQARKHATGSEPCVKVHVKTRDLDLFLARVLAAEAEEAVARRTRWSKRCSRCGGSWASRRMRSPVGR